MCPAIPGLRPVYRAGNENVIAVPFEGEAEFFKIQPNRYGSMPPRAEIGDGVLLLRHVRLDHDAEAVKSESERTMRSRIISAGCRKR